MPRAFQWPTRNKIRETSDISRLQNVLVLCYAVVWYDEIESMKLYAMVWTVYATVRDSNAMLCNALESVVNIHNDTCYTIDVYLRD